MAQRSDNGRCVLGQDGRIYGLGWPKDRSGFIAYRFDPENHTVKRYPVFGPPNEHRRELYGNATMCGDWLYAAIGAQPWHLVAMNVKTGKGRLLATTEEIIGDHRTIALTRMKGGFRGHICHAASIRHIDEFDQDEFPFWLHEGEIHARTDDIPPWSDSPAERDASPNYPWQREFQAWPRDFVPPSPPPLVERDSGAPDVHGRVELPYRPNGQKQWKTLRYDVQMYPGIVRLLTEINDHVPFATDEGYGQQVFYDLSTNELKRIGGAVSPYSIGVHQENLSILLSETYFEVVQRFGVKVVGSCQDKVDISSQPTRCSEANHLPAQSKADVQSHVREIADSLVVGADIVGSLTAR